MLQISYHDDILQALYEAIYKQHLNMHNMKALTQQYAKT